MTETPVQNAWLDFNDAPDQREFSERNLIDKEDLKKQLLDNLESHLFTLFPAGTSTKKEFKIGNVHGDAGDSLSVDLAGSKRGLWHDFATGEGGDILSLFAAAKGLDINHHFQEVISALRSHLGHAHDDALKNDTARSRPQKKQPPTDKYGPYTGKWDYKDADGKLIGVVYRHDYVDDKGVQRKIYFPYNPATRRYEAPTLRPLYNIPAILKSETVILCEGEKSAEFLNRYGFCATTAMNGAKAPIEKTDWSPLIGKHVIIWPDNDQPGKDYAERVSRELVKLKAKSVEILIPPIGKPEKWDAADIGADFDLKGFLASAVPAPYRFSKPRVEAFSVQEYLDDITPMPEDLIAPRILTPGGLMVVGGAPKVGKSGFMLSMFMHLAAGLPFLGKRPPRPLKIFYLQAEIQKPFVGERVRNTCKLYPDLVPLAGKNLYITPRMKIRLDAAGMQEIIDLIKRVFPDGGPDIICIDPIRNVFYGGLDGGGENDNAAMLYFLSECIDRLALETNPDAGKVLVHHTRKTSKAQFMEDPFQALSGAGALRSYYNTGIMLWRENEHTPFREIFFELRDGPSIDRKLIEVIDYRWIEQDIHSQRVANEKQGKKQDAERDRKTDVILELLHAQAREQSRLFTINSFAEFFAGQYGLGSKKTIEDNANTLARQGYIRFIKGLPEYGHPETRSRYGYMVAEGMILRHEGRNIPVLPTHFKSQNFDAAMPVEDPHHWPIRDDEEDKYGKK